MSTRTKNAESLDLLLDAIGNRLIELRIKKGYKSHAQFASEYGLPSIQYWRMEKGRANITLRSLHRILAIHEITLDQFFKSLGKTSASIKHVDQKKLK